MSNPQIFLTLDRSDPHIKVPVRYGNKAKYISIKINHSIVELILPNKNLRAGHEFLLEKEYWIRKKLLNFPKSEPVDKMTIPIFEEIYSLENIEAKDNKIEMRGGVIYIYSKYNHHNYLLIKFLKNILLIEINKIAVVFSKKSGLNFVNIKLMNNKSRWGSCSSKGALSFNWRLIFAPKDILEYLVAHEICHIGEMNHSKNFGIWYRKFIQIIKLLNYG